MVLVGKKFCPNCGSEEVEIIAAGITGNWMCKDCSYSGSIFPEKPILGSEDSLIDDKDKSRDRNKIGKRTKGIKKRN